MQERGINKIIDFFAPLFKPAKKWNQSPYKKTKNRYELQINTKA
jgi:hypothetical protein